MSPATPPLNRITLLELIERLEWLSRGECCNLAFDGDGTLWSGDVSDDVFLRACEDEWFLDSLDPSLCDILSRHGISTAGTTGERARRLFDAEKAGKVGECLLFEFMTWCYSGRSIAELSAYAETVLQQNSIDQRIRGAYHPLLEWARAKGHPYWLVTASPWPIVRVAAQRLGLDESQIIAARPATTAQGLIACSMQGPVPYREQKPALLRLRCRLPRLLAAFGDSPFDIDLLRAAELAVGVTPKPALLEQLANLHQSLIFDM